MSTDDVVVVNKPFGLEMFGEGQQHSLEKYLPKLAARVGAEELHQVHRLDKTTSGAVILVSRLTILHARFSDFCVYKIVASHLRQTNKRAMAL